MVDKKKMTGMIIHGFAIVHAIVAGLLAQTLIGDEAALTSLTVAMIIAVAKMNGADWDSGTALAFIGVFIGGYVGVRGAIFLIKWIPGIGNGANAAVTLTTTEVLGWATYLFVNSGKTDPGTITQSEKKVLLKKAKLVCNAEKREREFLYELMSKSDKEEYQNIMKQLGVKELPDTTRDYLLTRLQNIICKYI